MIESDNREICAACGDSVETSTGPGVLSMIHGWTCGRCGKRVCFCCGGHSPGLGYGEEDEKYGDLCLECYWELRESYAQRWESEFGHEASFDNPYELTQDDYELRDRLRSRAWRTEDG